jgi:tetratricopeptide (TPR) repeat protein
MKRIILTMGVMLVVSLAFTQQIAKQTDFSKIQKKIEKSNAEILNPKKNIVPKIWINRGNIMREDAFEAMLLSTRLEMPSSEFNLIVGKPKETKQEVEGESVVEVFVMDRINFFFVDGNLNSWEYTKPVFEEPLKEALKSYKKALELDQKGKLNKDLKEVLTKLKYNFISEGLNYYTRKNYASSYDYFATAIEVGEMPLVNYVDTAVIYYAGLSAQLAGNMDKAIEMYKKSIEYKFFSDGSVYFNLFDAYSSIDKAEEGLQYLEVGFTKHPKNVSLLYALINYYISKGDNPNRVLEYLNAAKIQEPNNASLFFAEGTLLDKLEEFDKAVIAYEKSIELNPEFFDALYNLGALHYNKGVKYLEEANKVPAREFEKYDALMSRANKEFKLSIPYMERAHQIDPEEKGTIETLKNLYFRFRMEGQEYKDKYDAILKVIEQQ